MDWTSRFSPRISCVNLRRLVCLILACGAASCDSGGLSPTALPLLSEPLTIDDVLPSVAWPGSTVDITGTGFTPGTTIVMGNAPATNVVVRSGERMTVTTPIQDAGTVDVVVTRPSGERAVLGRGYTNVAVTLTPDRTDPHAGDYVTVTWSASSGRAMDWIGLFAVGSPMIHWAEWGYEWQFTNGAVSGTWRVRPQEWLYPPGQYEFRYAVDGNLSGWAVHSVPVTIR